VFGLAGQQVLVESLEPAPGLNPSPSQLLAGSAVLDSLQPGSRDLTREIQRSLTGVVEIAWRDSVVAGDYLQVSVVLTDLHDIIWSCLEEVARNIRQGRRYEFEELRQV
jgi:hypothetical protein